MTLLEGLPTEIVSLIGDQMDPSSLVKLRSTSRTMNDHLSFNIKRLFKELWCPLNLPKMEEIFWLMRQPLANSVQSLIWIRPDGAFMESTRESSLFPWTLTGYVEGTAVKLFCGMWMSAGGFRNLRSIGWMPEEAYWAESDNDVLESYLSRGDMSFWSAVVKKIRKPVEVRVYERKNVYWGFSWTGIKETTTGAFVRTSFPIEVINSTDDDCSLYGWLTLSICLHHLSRLQDKLQSYFGSLELHHTIVESYYLGDLEPVSVKISESKIVHQLRSHLFSGGDIPANFTQSVRSLSILNCSLEAQEHSDVVGYFAGLRDHGQLRSFQFERNRVQHGYEIGGDLTFDWENDGRQDDGARLQGVIDDLGMEMALTKAIDCIHVPQEPLAAKVAEREALYARMIMSPPPLDETDSDSDDSSSE